MYDSIEDNSKVVTYWLFVGAVLTLFLPGWFMRLGLYTSSALKFGYVNNGFVKTWHLGPLGSVSRFMNEDFEGITRAMYKLGRSMIIKIEAK